ncbi:MAG: glycosyltransferase family 2 protein [Sulfuricella sp.]|nr:glycosyltransferase family 2 protein [Sulfuricella sp.]
MKLISIVTPCFNEEGNVDELYTRIRDQMATLPQYGYEHIFIDNASTDNTVAKIKEIAARDQRVKLIVNVRNFGHVRSPIHAILHAKGDAIIGMASDLQDPPELIPKFLTRWAEGFKVVLGVKPSSRESFAMSLVRRLYYRTIGRISDVQLIPDFTGFGLYDREVINIIRDLEDPYPYFRGLISELGFEYATIPFEQPRRIRGITKNNFYTLYDLAMLGITSHSKVPLRIATMAGFALSGVSLLIALGYLIAKLLFWDSFSLGSAPILIGIFFFASVQLFFIGILGEYIGAIHTQVLKRPLVIEKERVNFDQPDSE